MNLSQVNNSLLSSSNRFITSLYSIQAPHCPVSPLQSQPQSRDIPPGSQSCTPASSPAVRDPALTAYFERRLQLQEHGLQQEQFARLEAQAADLRLRQLHILSGPSAAHCNSRRRMWSQWGRDVQTSSMENSSRAQSVRVMCGEGV